MATSAPKRVSINRSDRSKPAAAPEADDPVARALAAAKARKAAQGPDATADADDPVARALAAAQARKAAKAAKATPSDTDTP